MRYRTKPAEIEAYLYEGDGMEALNWAGSITHIKTTYLVIELGKGLFVQTLEGRMEVSIGDYIVRGLVGELYACKPEPFHLKYERIEE